MKKKQMIVLTLLVAAMESFALEVDGIAAKVGEETILKSDIIGEMQRMHAPAEAYQQIRNEMIDRKLILKAAAIAKMTMQEWVVENRVRDIIKRAFNGDRNKLIDTLAKQKISYPEWYARMKENMIVEAMRWNVIDKNTTASPEAMRKEYREHPERYAIGAKVTLQMILLKPEDQSKRKEIDAALKTADFGELAKKYSSDVHAAEGGMWKDINPDDLFKKEICAEIEKMPKGTISHWVEIDGFSYLMRKLSEEKGKQMSFAEAYDKIEANVKEEVAKKMYEEWIERLRAETYIKLF